MTEKKTADSRRKALKSIAAGTGAVVAGKSLPESWAKPIVDSVILPAHALISDPALTSSPSECNDELTITEEIHSCSDSQTNEIAHYIDDSEECPVVKIGVATGEATSLYIHKYSTSFTVGIGFLVGGDNEQISVLCGQVDTSDSQGYEKQFSATSGAPWKVTFTLSRNNADKQVSVSNIVLIRV